VLTKSITVLGKTYLAGTRGVACIPKANDCVVGKEMVFSVYGYSINTRITKCCKNVSLCNQL
jgi:hypothetical protein